MCMRYVSSHVNLNLNVQHFGLRLFVVVVVFFVCVTANCTRSISNECAIHEYANELSAYHHAHSTHRKKREGERGTVSDRS